MPLLAGLGPLGVPELVIIAFIIVLIFGVGRLPEVGGAVGKGIREFRKATKDGVDGDASKADETPSTGASPASTLNSMPASPSPSEPLASSASGPAAASADTTAAAGETRFCSECGARNARSAKFCAECGNPMAAMAR